MGEWLWLQLPNFPAVLWGQPEAGEFLSLPTVAALLPYLAMTSWKVTSGALRQDQDPPSAVVPIIQGGPSLPVLYL